MNGATLEPALGGARPSTIGWIACGDSFTAGLAPGESWTDLVAAELGAGLPLRLRNVAAVGATTAQVAADQVPGAIAAGPDLLSLICGGNDVIGAVRPRIAELGDEIDAVFGRLAAALPATRLLTATYPPIAADALRPRTHRRISAGMETLNVAIRTAARRHRFACVELHDHPGRIDRRNYAADGIHPSPAGQQAAATVLGPAIEELLKASDGEEQRDP